MMNITLRSKVKSELMSTYNRFDRELFRYLLPPGAHLIEFGGSKKGAIVHLKLPLAGAWISEITEDKRAKNTCYFIDEGRKLPFPLKKWKHRHVLHRSDNCTIIEDHISFTTGTVITDLLFYPMLFFSFLPRIWQYKKYFNRT